MCQVQLAYKSRHCNTTDLCIRVFFLLSMYTQFEGRTRWVLIRLPSYRVFCCFVPSLLVCTGYFLQHQELLDVSTVDRCGSSVHCGHRDVHGVQVSNQCNAGNLSSLLDTNASSYSFHLRCSDGKHAFYCRFGTLPRRGCYWATATGRWNRLRL